MKILFYSLLILQVLNSCNSKSDFVTEENLSEKVVTDTTDIEVLDSTNQTKDVFEGFEYAKFKLDYYHNEGYSLGDRYWYEIIIIDSMLVLYFDCPLNDDWNYIHYHKSLILSDSQLESIKSKVYAAELFQKSEGFPHWSDWSGSGYGENRLHIDSENLNIAGGMIYNNIYFASQDIDYVEDEMVREMQESSTIGGDFILVFKELEKLFESLPFLLEDKKQSRN